MANVNKVACKSNEIGVNLPIVMEYATGDENIKNNSPTIEATIHLSFEVYDLLQVSILPI